MAFKYLAVAAAAVLTATVAQATDLPNKKAPPSGPLVKAAAYDWTGVYVGGSLGGAQTADDASSLSGDKLRRGVPGVYAGWNYRVADRFVVGVEADANYMGFEESDSGTTGGTLPGGNVCYKATNTPGVYSIRTTGKCNGAWTFGPLPDGAVGSGGGTTYSSSFSVRDLDTLRVRAGYLLTDNLLAFGTAGFGFAFAELNTNNGVDAAVSSSGYHSGWVAGGGLEYGYSKTVSMKLDYLYYDLGEIDDTISIVDLKGHLIRAGVATRF